jgi:hypothetical protein
MRNEKDFKKYISEIASDIAEAEVQIGASRVPLKQNKRNFEIKYVDMAQLGKSTKPDKPIDPDDPNPPKTIVPRDNMEDRARKIANKLSMEAQDFIKRVTFTKKRLGGSASKGYTIIFEVLFDSIANGKFVGQVTIPESEKLKPKSGTKGYEYQGSAFGKTTTGSERGRNPKISRDFKDDDSSPSIYEASEDKNKIVAGVVDDKKRFVRLEDVDWIQPSTKVEIKNFLKDLGSLELNESNNNNTEMRNEKEFKKRISEVASKIARLDEYDAEKMNLPDGILTRLNSSITTYADLAQAIIDIMKEITANEPSMQDLETKAGWNTVLQKLELLAGEKKGEEAPGTAPKKGTGSEPDNVTLSESFKRMVKLSRING